MPFSHNSSKFKKKEFFCRVISLKEDMILTWFLFLKKLYRKYFNPAKFQVKNITQSEVIRQSRRRVMLISEYPLIWIDLKFFFRDTPWWVVNFYIKTVHTKHFVFTKFIKDFWKKWFFCRVISLKDDMILTWFFFWRN